MTQKVQMWYKHLYQWCRSKLRCIQMSSTGIEYKKGTCQIYNFYQLLYIICCFDSSCGVVMHDEVLDAVRSCIKDLLVIWSYRSHTDRICMHYSCIIRNTGQVSICRMSPPHWNPLLHSQYFRVIECQHRSGWHILGERYPWKFRIVLSRIVQSTELIMFETPALVSFVLDGLIVVLYFNSPWIFGDSLHISILDMNPLNSMFTLVIVAGVYSGCALFLWLFVV